MGSVADELLHQRIRVGSAPDLVWIRNLYLFRIRCAVQVDSRTCFADPFRSTLSVFALEKNRFFQEIVYFSRTTNAFIVWSDPHRVRLDEDLFKSGRP
ncbi:hypothetical protein PO909_012101 [Leuciscus waleckii]